MTENPDLFVGQLQGYGFVVFGQFSFDVRVQVEMRGVGCAKAGHGCDGIFECLAVFFGRCSQAVLPAKFPPVGA